MKRPRLALGCTFTVHRRIGVHTVVNARSGETWRNCQSIEETERMRDAADLGRILRERLIVRRWRSRWFRKRFSHLLFED